MKKIVLIWIFWGTIFPDTISDIDDKLLELGVDDFASSYYAQEQDMKRKLEERVSKILDPGLFVVDVHYSLLEAQILDSRHVSVEKYLDGVQNSKRARRPCYEQSQSGVFKSGNSIFRDYLSIFKNGKRQDCFRRKGALDY